MSNNCAGRPRICIHHRQTDADRMRRLLAACVHFATLIFNVPLRAHGEDERVLQYSNARTGFAIERCRSNAHTGSTRWFGRIADPFCNHRPFKLSLNAFFFDRTFLSLGIYIRFSLLCSILFFVVWTMYCVCARRFVAALGSNGAICKMRAWTKLRYYNNELSNHAHFYSYFERNYSGRE